MSALQRARRYGSQFRSRNPGVGLVHRTFVTGPVVRMLPDPILYARMPRRGASLPELSTIFGRLPSVVKTCMVEPKANRYDVHVKIFKTINY